MRSLTRLHLWVLSTLSGKKEPVTRYEVMQTLNRAVALIDAPYSPGATYHAIKQLADGHMIEINQELLSITRSGSDVLHKTLIENSQDQSIASYLSKLLQAHLISDSDIRKECLKKVRIEMINYNQNGMESTQHSDSAMKAINICRLEIGRTISRIASELAD